MIGIDIVVIARIDKAIQKYGEKFLLRYLNETEAELADTPQRAAGFWAAKEAVAKALGTGIGKEVGFHDIVLSKNSKGAPSFQLSKPIVRQFRIMQSALSIAHDGGFAIAVVTIEAGISPINRS